MEIKAIETRYGGCRFRSRLEARWAVYFDALGIKWEYEKEGYDLGGLFYLPDFWLPQVSMWAEVKPTELNEIEVEKAKRLVAGTSRSLLMLVGQPSPRSYWSIAPIWVDGLSSELDAVHPDEDDAYATDYIVDADYLSEDRFFHCTGTAYPDGFDLSHDRDIMRAVEAARSARFDDHSSSRRREA